MGEYLYESEAMTILRNWCKKVQYSCCIIQRWGIRIILFTWL